MGNVIRKKTVTVGVPGPAALRGAGGAGVSGNNVTNTSGVGGSCEMLQQFTFADDGRGSYVEARVHYGGTFDVRLGLTRATTPDANGIIPALDYEVRIVSAIGGGQIKIYNKAGT